MSDEQHENPEEKPNKSKSLFSFFRPWKLHGNKDRGYPDQQRYETSPVESGMGGFVKDYGFQIIIILINGTLAWYTANLYHTAVSQSEFASISAQAAREAVAEYRRANDLAQRNFDSSRESSRVAFDLTKQTANSQIKTMQGALAQTKRQFEIENEPYLEIYINSVYPLKIGEPITIDISYRNYGTYPVKTVTEQMGVFIGSEQPAFEVVLKKGQSFSAGQYIIKEVPNTKRVIADANLNEIAYKKFVNKISLLYIGGHIEYQNLVTKKIKTYNFLISVGAENLTLSTFLLNENKTKE